MLGVKVRTFGRVYAIRVSARIRRRVSLFAAFGSILRAERRCWQPSRGAQNEDRMRVTFWGTVARTFGSAAVFHNFISNVVVCVYVVDIASAGAPYDAVSPQGPSVREGEKCS